MNRLTISLLLLGLTHLNVSAQWIEAHGEANVLNNNVNQAREEAIQQALSVITLQSGGQFTSMQQTQNGQLVQSQFSMSNQANIARVELLSERIENQQITVTLRADVIDGADQQCQAEPLKAAILVPQASIADRAQLRYGNIGHFEQALSERLGNIIQQRSNASLANVHANERLDVEQSLVDVRGYRLPSWLSDITDSQYILLPAIVDISTDPVEGGLLGLWNNYPQRQFHLKLSLYHGISGEQVWSELYHSSAPWEFERQATVPANSARFWHSSYGQHIDAVLAQASADIDKVLNCRPLLGQIVSKQDRRVIINLGRNNGIKVGDRFQIVLQQNLPDRLDNMRPIAGETRATVTIDQVTQQSATALLEPQNGTLNIQVNDIAIKM